MEEGGRGGLIQILVNEEEKASVSTQGSFMEFSPEEAAGVLFTMKY